MPEFADFIRRIEGRDTQTANGAVSDDVVDSLAYNINAPVDRAFFAVPESETVAAISPEAMAAIAERQTVIRWSDMAPPPTLITRPAPAFTLYMNHGRLDLDGTGSDIDGNPIDGWGWGFDGPELAGVRGFHITYGTMFVFFTTVEYAREAQHITGWANGHTDESLELPAVNDCLRIENAVRGRTEYFGDWGLRL